MRSTALVHGVRRAGRRDRGAVQREVRSEQANPTCDMRTPHTPAAKKLPEADSDPAPLCERDGSGCLAKAAANPDAMRAALAGYPVIRASREGLRGDRLLLERISARLERAAGRPCRRSAARLAQRVRARIRRRRSRRRARGHLREPRRVAAHASRQQHTDRLDGRDRFRRRRDAPFRRHARRIAGRRDGARCVREALRPIEAADVDRCAEMAASSRSCACRTCGSWRARATGVVQAERAGTWVTFNAPQWAGWVAEQDARYCEVPPTGMLADTPRPGHGRAQHRAARMHLERHRVHDGRYRGVRLRRVTTSERSTTRRTCGSPRRCSGCATRRAPEPVAQRFDARPPALRSGQRRSGYDAKDGTLFVDNMHGALDEPFQTRARDAAPAAGTDGVAAK